MAVKCILTGQTPSVLDGVTENVQTQLDSKESKINLTANRAVVVGADGKLAVSAVTSTELGYLDGVTSNIQSQLDNKLSSAPVTSVAGKTGAVTLAKSDVGLGNVDNTSDVNKPISTATQTALDAKQDKITATGLLSGDGNGGVTAAEETEVELVEITPDTIGAQSKITASGLLKGDGAGGVSAAVANEDYRTDVGLVYNDTQFYYEITDSQAVADIGAQRGVALTAGDMANNSFAQIKVAQMPEVGFPTFSMVSNSFPSGEELIAVYDTSGKSNKSGNINLFAEALVIEHEGNSVTSIKGIPTPTTDTGAANKAYVDSKLGGTTLSVTLASASWTGDSAPYTYTVSNSAITATSTQELSPATSITADQLTALQAANIIDGGQAAGSMTLKAFGEKPSIDIPVRIIVKG